MLNVRHSVLSNNLTDRPNHTMSLHNLPHFPCHTFYSLFINTNKILCTYKPQYHTNRLIDGVRSDNGDSPVLLNYV